MPLKPTRGGPRPNSGPKPKHGPKQKPCSFGAPASVIAALDACRKEAGMTRGEWIASDPRLAEAIKYYAGFPQPTAKS